MGVLPDDFQFSQASLQDYVDCRRRFQLRYLLELAWPAIQAEPAEDQEMHGQQGELFHRLVQQHQLGIPAARLASMAQAADRQRGDSRRTTCRPRRRACPANAARKSRFPLPWPGTDCSPNTT
jgi:hypothetical protein